MLRVAPAVFTLLSINAALFVVGALVPGLDERLLVAGAFWFPRNEHFAVWQPLTYMFLHAGWAHLLFNMFALVSFGVHLEQRWGTRRFVTFYLLCGIGAGLIHSGVSVHDYANLEEGLRAAGLSPALIESVMIAGQGAIPGGREVELALAEMYQIYAAPMLGASGAIYGVLVAFGLLFPNAKLALLFFPVPIAAKFVIPALLLLDLFSEVTGFSLFGAGIAHLAHLGGALIGFLLVMMWRRKPERHSGGDWPSQEANAPFRV